MGSDATVAESLPNPCSYKVHRKICMELMTLVTQVSPIFSNIEEARPRCTSGIQALCLLSKALDKAKLILRYCCESSKIYLALTGEKIVLRCKNSITLMVQSLNELQTMVPVTLAAQISRTIDDLRSASFLLDTAEHEAGKVVKDLLQQDPADSDSVKDSLIRSLKFLASKLQITSSKALLTEKRSIKKLLVEVGEHEMRKRDILRYILSLLNKYGNIMLEGQFSNGGETNEGAAGMENSSHVYLSSKSSELGKHNEHEQLGTQKIELCSVVPEEFRCPISLKLMYDPVVIASGQTYERMWVQKWFDEGNDSCPKTKMKLAHLSLTPNVAMKDLISKWCAGHGVNISDPSKQQAILPSWESSSTSIASLGSSMNDFRFHVDLSNVSLGSTDTNHTSDSLHASSSDGVPSMLMNHNYCSRGKITHTVLLSKISNLGWDSKCQLIEDVKNHLKCNYQVWKFVSSENFVDPLLKFIRDAYDLHDVKAQRAGNQLFFEFLTNCRNGLSYLTEDAYSTVAMFLDSEVTEEALAITEVLSGYQQARAKLATSDTLTSIVNSLDSRSRELQQKAIRILCNLSSNSEVCSQLIPLNCVSKLVQFLVDSSLAGQCMCIVRNLCNVEEGRVSVVETSSCVSSVAELLESDSQEDQEHALAVLLSLCSQRVEYCELFMAEGVIPSLVSISVKGSKKGKARASELLRLLRDINFEDDAEGKRLNLDANQYSNKPYIEKKSPKASGIFGMKVSLFSKHSSLASREKR